MATYNSKSVSQSYSWAPAMALTASSTDNVSDNPRVRHQHSQSMDGLTTIKTEILTSCGEEPSSAETKKAMSAAKLA
ncbi:hypothetical protein RND71_023464 [Anisodus tanguticus]|uniref:Uncharacterized protein n=1 Tax=Anisodus tanguticus TaxID=243964 RepID=A0AAE1RSM8_9SOLA|nr:hypothetical protein RND71_023464 [Anisodus tanguticus]